MKNIIYIGKNSNNFINFFLNKKNGILYTDLNKKKIIEIKKKKLLPFVEAKSNIKIFLKNNIKFILWNDHPFSINKNYDYFLSSHENYFKNKKLYISTFDCYKHLVKNYIPFWPSKIFSIKVNNKFFYKKKKYDVIFMSGNNKINYLHYILYLPIYLISIFFWKKNIFLKDIFKNPLVIFFTFFSLGSTRSKYFILMSFINNFRRNYIKKELEKIDNLNIIYAGSKKFCPTNVKNKNYYDWLDSKQVFKIFTNVKLIIVVLFAFMRIF